MISFAPANPVYPDSVISFTCPAFVGRGSYNWTLYRSADASGSNRTPLRAGVSGEGFSATYSLTEPDMYYFLIAEVDGYDLRGKITTVSESYYCGNENG